MKAVKLTLLLAIMLMAGAGHPQFSMSVSFGVPPPWGPAGYTAVRYYYLPDVEAYYDVRSSSFIYFGGGAWVHSASLPGRYRNYDLYHGYKVVMPDYRGSTPYSHFKEHKMKYGKGYHGKFQRTNQERPGIGKPGQGRPYEVPRKKQGNGNGNNINDHGNKGGGHEKQKNDGHGHDNGNGNRKNK